MIYKRNRITINDVMFKTQNAKEYVERCNQIVFDTKKQERHLKQECQLCFYNSKIGGAAMSHVNCRLCDKEMSFGSTCTDELCIDCAKKHKLCKHCAGDIDLKTRRKI